MVFLDCPHRGAGKWTGTVQARVHGLFGGWAKKSLRTACNCKWISIAWGLPALSSCSFCCPICSYGPQLPWFAFRSSVHMLSAVFFCSNLCFTSSLPGPGAGFKTVCRHARSTYRSLVLTVLNSKKENVSNFVQILRSFAESSRLNTNVQKSSVVSIHCEQINLEDVLEGFPATWTTFPIKYLGLPLYVTWLRRVDYQPLANKAAGSLASWRGKNVAIAKRATLVKTVLSSQPSVYKL